MMLRNHFSSISRCDSPCHAYSTSSQHGKSLFHLGGLSKDQDIHTMDIEIREKKILSATNIETIPLRADEEENKIFLSSNTIMN